MIRPPPRSTLFPYTTPLPILVFETWHTPLRDEQGQLTGMLGVANDVTERMRLEDQLRQSQKMERSEEHTCELQSRRDLVCRLLLEKKKKQNNSELAAQE